MGQLTYDGPDNPPVGNQITNHIDVATGQRINPDTLSDYDIVETVPETGRGLPRTNIFVKHKS
jgi:hypothetical protein